MEKKLMGTLFLLVSLISGAIFFVPVGQTAPSDYPNRPIEVVVHSSPGGIVDTSTRIVSDKLSEILGVSLLITNKPAGSGAAGIETIVKAKPDGYTILGGADTALILVPAINPEFPYRYTNLIPIAWCSYTPNVICVRGDSPFKTLQDLLDFARKNPGKLNFGSAGAAFINHITFQFIRKAAGVNIVTVPYQGAQAKMALVGGHVDVANDTYVGLSGLINSGKIRALAVCASKRLEEFPEVPTALELGYAKATIPVRAGYLAPLGTPQQIIDKWSQAIQKALADPAVKNRMKKADLTLEYKPRDEMVKGMEELNQTISTWVKEGGLTEK